MLIMNRECPSGWGMVKKRSIETPTPTGPMRRTAPGTAPITRPAKSPVNARSAVHMGLGDAGDRAVGWEVSDAGVTTALGVSLAEGVAIPQLARARTKSAFWTLLRSVTLPLSQA